MTKATDQAIVKAALATVRDEGFAGASSRAIARRGGFNQALIFYHFGSLENLLLTALRQTSEERLAIYHEIVDPITRLDELIPAMADLWSEDYGAGHVRIVAQMIAGSANRPELAATRRRADRALGRARRADLRPGPPSRAPDGRPRLRHRRLVPRREPDHAARSGRDANRRALQARARMGAARRAAARRVQLLR